MPQATSIDKPAIREAYEDVRSDSTETIWYKIYCNDESTVLTVIVVASSQGYIQI